MALKHFSELKWTEWWNTGDNNRFVEEASPLAFPKRTVRRMSETADQAIEKALVHGSVGMKAKPRTEVAMVAAVTLGGIPDIAKSWQSLLRSVG
jgi:hypothetical protein